jgi:hypothetical protein
VRDRVYGDAASNRSFDPHFLHPVAVRAWPIWKELDVSGHGKRVAVAAGYDLFPNWYWYPLLGSGLQNEVIYVPLAADGSVVDYRDPNVARARGSYPAWLARLVDAGIDELVLLAPSPPEWDWVMTAPEIFEPDVAAVDGSSSAFRFRADRAREFLARGVPDVGR